MVDPARKIRIGNKLYFGEDESLVAEVIDNTTSRGRTLRFLFDGKYEEFKETLFSLGETPVPRWVKDKTTKEDRENFQTIFAKNEGAVSAPAAGLHFSRELFNRMILADIDKTFIEESIFQQQACRQVHIRNEILALDSPQSRSCHHRMKKRKDICFFFYRRRNRYYALPS